MRSNILILSCYHGSVISVYIYNEPLTTSPVAAYIVLMVHVVKVVNTHIDAGASIAEMESKINFRLQVSMLQSKEMNSRAQYSFRTSDRSRHDACYK